MNKRRILKLYNSWLGAVPQHFGRPRWADHPRPGVLSLRPAWPTWRNPISTKNTKISRAWWHAPVVSTTLEAVAEESLEPEGQRCSEL